MHVLVTSFQGNPHVGLLGCATASHMLIGPNLPKKIEESVAKTVGLPLLHFTIAKTSLVGVFAHWTGKTLLVPSVITEQECAILDGADIPYTIIETNLTCLGNNILSNEKGALLNPDFNKSEVAILQKHLGVPCIQTTLQSVEAVGAVGVLRKGHGLFHRDLSETEKNLLQKHLGVEVSTGTINLGSPYVASGILLGEEGYLIGDLSGGPEMVHADEALGFLE